MPKQRTWILLITLAAFLFLPFFALSESGKGDIMLINNDGYKNKKKGPVPFTHDDHSESYGFSCDECHHVYEMGRNIWEEGDEVQRCKDCHDPRESKGKVSKLQIAFHNKCKDCHKETGSDTAPYRTCYGCHK